MKSKSSRRGFLALLGTAPIAAPVVAKDAAATMGLLSLGRNAASVGATVMGYDGGPPNVTSRESWAARSLRLFWSRRSVKVREVHADALALVLSPNLASLRSISPAAAYAINRTRSRAKINDDYWTEIQEDIAEETKSKIMGGLS